MLSDECPYRQKKYNNVDQEQHCWSIEKFETMRIHREQIELRQYETKH